VVPAQRQQPGERDGDHRPALLGRMARPRRGPQRMISLLSDEDRVAVNELGDVETNSWD
jgi:hypothetical protein